MLEQLYNEMMNAFWVWSQGRPVERNHLWDDYTKKREAFLKEHLGDKYQAIQVVEYFKNDL